MGIRDLGVGTVRHDYQAMWQTQREMHAEVAAGNAADTFLLLEHEQVFTAGRRTEPGDLPTDGSAVIEVDRGGRITWHGPGQIVCYAITRLPQPLDVVAHVRRLEQVTEQVCADFEIATQTIPGRSGVWVAPDQFRTPQLRATSGESLAASKIGAVGVRVANGVSLHGLSLNVNCDLGWSNQIIPCGISDAGVTSISQVLGREVTPREVVGHFESAIRAIWPEVTATPETTTTAAPTKVEV